MKILKNRLFLVVVTAIICISGTAFAVAQINAVDITYDNTDSGLTSTDVQGAINELYSLASSFSNVEVYSSGLISKAGTGTFWTKNVAKPAGVEKIEMYLEVSSAYGPIEPTIEGNTILSRNITALSSGTASARYAYALYKIEITTTDDTDTIKINARVSGNTTSYNHSANLIIVY